MITARSRCASPRGASSRQGHPRRTHVESRPGSRQLSGWEECRPTCKRTRCSDSVSCCITLSYRTSLAVPIRSRVAYRVPFKTITCPPRQPHVFTQRVLEPSNSPRPQPDSNPRTHAVTPAYITCVALPRLVFYIHKTACYASQVSRRDPVASG